MTPTDQLEARHAQHARDFAACLPEPMPGLDDEEPREASDFQREPLTAQEKAERRERRVQQQAAEAARAKAEAERTFELAKGQGFQLRKGDEQLRLFLAHAAKDVVGWNAIYHRGMVMIPLRFSGISGRSMGIGVGGIEANVIAESMPSGAQVMVITQAEIVR